ncbi:MAG: hypothetical protein HY369_04215 [Candidatus Aenigmarchaeota archaeon]|nr:hypothetical protein [Candidatus Aenigmarchaeota archaeon]
MQFTSILPILLLVGVVAVSGCTQPASPADEPPVIGPPADEPTNGQPTVTPSVTVSDQTVQAGSVVVAEVVSDGPGWMTIHNDVNGGPGAVIGQTLVADGENSNVIVTVDTAQFTPTLYAMLHTDAGVLGTYEFPGPDAPVILDGAAVSPGFQATLLVANDTNDTVPAQQTFTVEMSAAGYSPSPLTITAGDTVTFVNIDGSTQWPASAFHPTHTVYPGSDIAKCGTTEEATIFDACKTINLNEEWSFTFTEVGEWNYHNHNNPAQFGKIIVQ